MKLPLTGYVRRSWQAVVIETGKGGSIAILDDLEDLSCSLPILIGVFRVKNI